MLRRILPLVLLVLAAPASAQDGCDDPLGHGVIGVFADAAGTSSCITAPYGEPTTAYVLAILGGHTSNGIAGAEFRLEFSIDPASSYLIACTPAPAANATTGDPLDFTPGSTIDDPKGLDIAFPSCQGDHAGQRILLGTLDILPFLPVPLPFEIATKRRSPPSDVNHDCPTMLLCGGPLFTVVCLTPPTYELDHEPITGRAGVNQSPCNGCPPPETVAVAPGTWTGVKSLYRD